MTPQENTAERMVYNTHFRSNSCKSQDVSMQTCVTDSEQYPGHRVDLTNQLAGKQV